MMTTIYFYLKKYLEKEIEKNYWIILNKTNILLTDIDNIFHKYFPLSDFQDRNCNIIYIYEIHFSELIFQ